MKGTKVWMAERQGTGVSDPGYSERGRFGADLGSLTEG
jgi:hypothetical protein